MKKYFTIKRKDKSVFLIDDMIRETCEIEEAIKFDNVESAYRAIEKSLKTRTYEIHPYVYIDCDLYVAGNITVNGGIEAEGDVVCFAKNSSSNNGWSSKAKQTAMKYGINGIK